MHSTALAALATALVFTGTAVAQTPQTAPTPQTTQTAKTAPPATNAKITVRGCVSPSTRDGSLETKAAPITPTPETAPREANNGDQMVGYLLTDAKLVTSGQPNTPAQTPTGTTGTYLSQPTSFTLQGLEPELLKHKGHRVEVVGTVMPPTAAAGQSSAKKVAEGIQRLRIESLKMVGNDCAAKPLNP
jgi:hypothetical protein